MFKDIVIRVTKCQRINIACPIAGTCRKTVDDGIEQYHMHVYILLIWGYSWYYCCMPLSPVFIYSPGFFDFCTAISTFF